MFRIKPYERVAIAGKTGSGKTYFARAVLSVCTRLVVCDAKGKLGGAEAGWGLTEWPKGLDELKKGKLGRIRIPPMLEDDEWEEKFGELYKLRNVTIYIDELYGVGPPEGSRGLRALYTRGRELGIGVWSCTQRPVKIPLYAFSEAEWIIQFQLRLKQDIERMEDMIGDMAALPLKDHNFLLYNDSFEMARFYDRFDPTDVKVEHTTPPPAPTRRQRR